MATFAHQLHNNGEGSIDAPSPMISNEEGDMHII